jgi:3-hydroxyisobutyrate dehydrogenase
VPVPANIATARSRAGVIGLGQIGGGVARALVRAGFEPTVHDVREEAAALVAGAVVAGSAAEVAARSDVVLLAVVDEDQVREALTGENGVFSAEEPPAVVAVLSTISVAAILALAEEGGAYGVAVIDCGVTGGVTALEHSAIVALVGGAADVVELARPVLEGFASPVMHMGPLGAGMQAKIARNVIQWTEWLVAWEAAVLARAAGIDVQQLVAAVRASKQFSLDDLALIEQGVGLDADGPRTEALSQERMEHRVVLGHKDLRAALALAAELGVQLRSPLVADELLDEICGAQR